MRKPSEFIAAAVRRVQSSLMPDCALTLTHGGSSALVTRAAHSMRGEDELSGGEPTEQVRVLALASDFPEIEKGDTAWLGAAFHIVTSVRTDCAGASAYIGLSQPLTQRPANVIGVRGARALNFPLDILVANNGLASDVTDGFAPTTVHAWTLCVAVESWPETGEPQIGDEFRFEKDGEDVRVKVSRCDRRDLHYVISARSR